MKLPLIIRNFYFHYFFRVKKGKCLFIPHPGFTKNDKASIINYKSDNCLIFVRYLLDNNLYKEKEIIVVSTTLERSQKEQEFCRNNYPLANIKIIPNVSREVKTAWASSEYIVGSEDRFPYKKKKGQKYICLGYYPVSLKNDYFDTSNSIFGNRLKFAQEIDAISSCSLINSQMDSSAYSISFGLFSPIGKCRSDVMKKDENVLQVMNYFKNICKDYKFSKIILYTPTHRDYELSEFDIKRSILGFAVDKYRFEKFLKDNEILIICKLHPHQNAEILETEMPTGVINFTGNEYFGLVELMQVSDILMTDYSSAYIDYLLLDKPVVFNMYDLELYQQSRGLAFYPFKRICAGEIFTDEVSFYNALKETLNNPNKYRFLRQELLDEMLTHRTDVCKKTYESFFI